MEGGGDFFQRILLWMKKTKMPKGDGHPFIHLASIQKIRPKNFQPKMPKPIQPKFFCV